MAEPDAPMWLIWGVLFCFLVAAVGVDLFRRWAPERLLDVPNPRSSHVRPTPRGAGIVIVATVFLAGFASGVLGFSGFPPAGAVGAASIIVIVSAVDDVRPLGSSVRLLVHVACATLALTSIGVAGSGASAAIASVLAILWLVGLTNAYNFMDGIDGIAGAQAVVAGTAVAAAGAYADLGTELVVGAAIAAASAGFLLHNWWPARVFMGDVGSAFLGFVFAALALAVARVSLPLAIGIAASLWPFIFDTSLTFVRRAARREDLLRAHRSHLYQRLVIAGWSHAKVALLYGSAALCGAAAALAWAAGLASAPILLLIPLMAVTLWVLVTRRETAVAGRPPRAGDPYARH